MDFRSRIVANYGYPLRLHRGGVPLQAARSACAPIEALRAEDEALCLPFVAYRGGIEERYTPTLRGHPRGLAPITAGEGPYANLRIENA